MLEQASSVYWMIAEHWEYSLSGFCHFIGYMPEQTVNKTRYDEKVYVIFFVKTKFPFIIVSHYFMYMLHKRIFFKYSIIFLIISLYWKLLQEITISSRSLLYRIFQYKYILRHQGQYSIYIRHERGGIANWCWRC